MLSREKKDAREVKDDSLQVKDKGEGRESSLINETNVDEMFLDSPVATEVLTEKLDEVTKREIQRRIYSITKHQNAISPIKCRGEDCEYIGTCPFEGTGLFPLSQQCSVEQSLIASKYNDYCTSFNVDRREPSPADMSLINRLVEIELTEYRLRAVVASKYPEVLVQETIGAHPQTGAKITKLAPSPVFQIRKKLSEEKTLLLKELVGTRKETYRERAAMKQGASEDYSSYIASLNKQLRELVEAQKKK